MRVSAFDVLEKYFNTKSSEFTKTKKGWIGPCPFHKETNGASLLIYDKGDRFDWTCMGKCHTGGEAPHMLVTGGIADSIKQAITILETDFNLQPPDYVSLTNFSEYKGISMETLLRYGLHDHHYYNKEGNESTGLAFPLYDVSGEQVALKVRTAYTGQKRFFYHAGECRWFGLQFLQSFNREEPLYICEGESDTLSAADAGLQAIGFLGSTGFTALPELQEFSKLVIACDNDTAGQTLLRTAKQMFPNTLYTISLGKYNDINELWQYNRKSFVQLLTPFPAVPEAVTMEYMECGDMWRLLFAGLSALEANSLVARLATERKLPKRLLALALKTYWRAPERPEQTSARLYRKGNCYATTRFVGGEPQEELISNFVLNVRFTIKSDDGTVVRVATLTNAANETSDQVYLTGSILANSALFRETVISAGNYNWRGSQEDLVTLIDILQEQGGEVIFSPSHIGRLDGVWLLGNHGIDKEGQVVCADEDGILTLSGKRFIVRNINTDPEDETSFPQLPNHSTDPDLRAIAQTMKQSLGGYEAYMALGFCVAGWHSNEIFNADGERNFPIFFIAGKRNSGKSMLANWLMSAYGFQGDGTGKNFALPSVVSMTRKLGYYASLPLWYDDYRNTIRDLDRRNQLLLGAYNRQGGDKATRTGFSVRTETLRGLLLLSGEDLPHDNAVYSRCSTIHVSANRRDDSVKAQMFRLAEQLPQMGLMFLTNKQRTGSASLLERIKYIQTHLEEQGIDTRMAKNKAVFAASFLHEFGAFVTDEKEFLEWLTKDTKEDFEDVESSHALIHFFEDISNMLVTGELLYGTDVKMLQDNTIALRFSLIYDKWLRRTKNPEFSKKIIKAYLEQEGWVVDTRRKVRFGDGVSTTAFVVNGHLPCENFYEVVRSKATDYTEF